MMFAEEETFSNESPKGWHLQSKLLLSRMQTGKDHASRCPEVAIAVRFAWPATIFRFKRNCHLIGQSWGQKGSLQCIHVKNASHEMIQDTDTKDCKQTATHPVRGAPQKWNRFFGKVFPNVGGWGGWFPKKVQTPQNPPKLPIKKSPFSTQISLFVFPNLTKPWWVGKQIWENFP